MGFLHPQWLPGWQARLPLLARWPCQALREGLAREARRGVRRTW